MQTVPSHLQIQNDNTNNFNLIPRKNIVSPGAKERLVQITGPNEEKIK